MRVFPLENVLIGLVILPVELDRHGVERGLPVRDGGQVGTLKIRITIGVPIGLGDQIVVQ